MHQCYVVNRELLYTIAVHSPADQFDRYQESLNAIRDSIEFIAVDDAERYVAHSPKGAAIRRVHLSAPGAPVEQEAVLAAAAGWVFRRMFGSFDVVGLDTVAEHAPA